MKRPVTKRPTNTPTPFDTLDIASVDGLAGPPTQKKTKKKLIDDLTGVTKRILGIDDGQSPNSASQTPNPYEDCFVNVVVPRTTNCINVYPDGIPIPVTICYEYTISILDYGGSCNVNDANELVTAEILFEEYTDDLALLLY